MSARALLRPELLLSALVLVAALAFALRRPQAPPLVTVEVATPEVAAAPVPVTLILIVPGGARRRSSPSCGRGWWPRGCGRRSSPRPTCSWRP